MNSAAMLHQRRSGILAFTFVELLILMVFMTIMYAFAIEHEVELKATEIEKKLRLANRKIKVLEKENFDLKVKVKELKVKVKELETRLEQYRLSDGSFVDAKTVKRYVSNLRPSCTVPDDFLYKVNLLENGRYQIITTSWASKAGNAQIRLQIPGLTNILRATSLSERELDRFGRQIYNYSETLKCRYRIDASGTVQHTDLSLYLKQMSRLDKYFYTLKPKESQ